MKALMLVTCLAGLTVAAPEPSYTEEDFWYLSHVIQAESGYCSMEMMEGVGSVVLNRVADERFPDSIRGVIEQPGQYSTLAWLESQAPTDEVLKVTTDLLDNGSKFPENVVFQANFPQGSGIYQTLSTSYSTMYFCTG